MGWQPKGCETYLWNFGDGGTSTLPQPAHNYQTANTYTVSLILTGASAQTISRTVVVAGQSGGTPQFTADFSYTQAGLATGTALTFLPSTNPPGAGKTFKWTFGDGAQTTNNSPDPVTHIYDTANGSGPFNVVLEVTGTSGPSRGRDENDHAGHTGKTTRSAPMTMRIRT